MKKKYVGFLVLVALVLLGFLAFAPTYYSSVCGIGGSNAHLSQVDAASASVRMLVRDTKGTQMWEQFWAVSTEPDSTIKMTARIWSEKSIFGLRLPFSNRGIVVVLPLGRDVHGQEKGFSYDVQWIRKDG